MSEFRNIMEYTIDKALKQGATQADLILGAGSNLSAKTEDAAISDYSVNSSQSIGLRVIRNKKVGLSYCESFDDVSLDTLVESALRNSQYSKEEPHEEITLSRKEGIDGTSDETYSDLRVDPKELLEASLNLEKKMLSKDKRLKTPPYNSIGEHVSETYYLNHLGTFCKEKGKLYSGYTTALISDGSENAMHYHASLGREFSDLNFDEVIEESYKFALSQLSAKPIATGRYQVLFTPDMLSSLYGAFSNIFSGKAAVNETNPFKDHVGEIISHKELNLRDVPNKKGGFNYAFFDSEGNLASDTSLIENGVLKTFLHNSATAAALGVDNTFNASRSTKGPLGVSNTHTVISSGSTPQASFSDEEYFEIVALQGLHSGCNRISGDFSFAANGYLKRGGEIIQGVKGVTVSGNYFEALKNIKFIGQDVKMNTNRNFFSPDILFADLSVAGS